MEQPSKTAGMSYPSSPDPEHGMMEEKSQGTAVSRFVDSFRRAKGVTVTPAGAVGADGEVFERDDTSGFTAPPLAHKLKARHLQMIAIGGSIGSLSLSHKLVYF